MALYHIQTNVPILHSMTGSRAESHFHSLTIELYISCPGEGMLRFRKVEELVDWCLAPYKNRFLNDMPEFNGDASIEEAGEVFCEKLRRAMEQFGLTLERFEIQETPLRAYIIHREGSDAI